MYRYLLLWNLDGLEMFNWLSRHMLKFQRLFPLARLNHHNGSNMKSVRLQHASNTRVYLPAGLFVRGQCPICEAGEQSERSRLCSLMERLTSPEFQAKYRSSDGLCLPHLNQALDTVNDPQLRQFLIQVALEKLETAAGRLHRTVEQPKQDEASSQVSRAYDQTCSRTIAWLVGNRPAINLATEAQHLPQSLDEAFRLDACPVCMLTAASRQGDLQQRLTEPTIEESLCHDHAWQLCDLAIAQTHESRLATIVYAWVNRASAQLRTRVADHATNSERRDGRWRGRIKQRIAREPVKRDGSASARPDCSMCQSEAASEEEHVAHFLKQLGDTELRQRYAASRGLCLPHLRSALRSAAPREARLFLATTAHDRVADLVHLIEEYERKHIWNYRDEPKLAEEQNSWIRAVAFEVGEPIWAWKISPIH
jgi:hypothetical protein